MSIKLTDDEAGIVRSCHKYVDEVYIEDRKGVPQTVYVVQVLPDAAYWCDEVEDFKPVPEHLVGYWKQRYAQHNPYSADYMLSHYGSEWCKCEPVEKVITITEWKEIP